MRFSFILLINILLISAPAFPQTAEDSARKLFDEGMSLSVKADDEREKRNFEVSNHLYQKALRKYFEVLKKDSLYSEARRMIGHTFYLLGDYTQSIFWNTESLKYDTVSYTTFFELGMCKIGEGMIKDGREDIEKAFELNNSERFKENTILDLRDIGIRSFNFGSRLEAHGDSERARNYKEFGIGVLITAFDMDKSQRKIARIIASYAEKMGDAQLAAQYKKLGRRK